MKPASLPALRSRSTFPAAREPNRKFSPTTTAEAFSSSTSTRWMNSSGLQPAISRLNASTRTSSAP